MASFKKVLQRPKVQENLGRNPFDRSFIRNVHCSHGQIIPVMMEPCIAGTKGVINRQSFVRSFDIVSPAFPQVTQCFDFFKVPIRYLWSKWNDWKLNINDVNSSTMVAFDQGGALSSLGNIPRMDFGYVSSSTSYLWDRVLTAFGTEYPTMTNSEKCLYLHDMQRLCEGLGYGSFNNLQQGGSANVKNLLPIAAYQKVYYDHYRNTTYENNNPYSYNLDWMADGTNVRDGLLDLAFDSKDIQVFRNLFTLRYVNYRNDYFRNLYPSLNFSSSTPSGSSWILPNISGLGSSTGSSPNIYLQPAVLNPAQSTVGLYKTNITSTNASNISVQALRASFALDKLLRASAYAPKHVKDQFKARFGVDVGDKVSYESERLGSFKDDVVFGEVTNMAESASYNLGSLGGKGIGSSKMQDDINFYCEEDSIIIGVTYFLVRAIYDCVEDEWNNKLIREDFFQPEFQNLGLRVVTDVSNNILGYTTPNLRYKLGKDLNFGMFKKNYTEFSVSTGGTVVPSYTSTNALRTFTVHSMPPTWSYFAGGVNYNYFKALPSHLDYIFRTNYNADGKYDTDQFYFNLMIKFAVTQNMSVHGQPSL